MQFFNFAFLALAATALAAPLADQTPNPTPNELAERALGINCRGSEVSAGAGTGGHSLGALAGLISEKLDMNRAYKSGEHIACSGTKSSTGLCIFPQSLKVELKGQHIKDLLNRLMAHGCKTCGSVPVDAPNSNNPANGILTSNWVGNTGGCNGMCK
ncbi:hypothetical protein K469DRAFT_695963 [Zopfia rhizophila CBS 207.26]|uniref:Killer toxin Kp4 domain-containing protein n=1 Tax=Zopfia rhizophila CBS 207.26 TaxID=1314779 RepID=A0A6A6ELN5_9PEZI|nr:hypothetical protein K469DRAFT_695963 [Zopfia rhizophila CBS 207.26]